MEFKSIVVIAALVILILGLAIYGVYYGLTASRTYKFYQDDCPKLWRKDSNGNCINPTDCTNADKSACNTLAPGAWQTTTTTPGYIDVQGNIGFNPNDNGWKTYGGAKSDICGKKKWAATYNIEWNGVSTYDKCV